MATIVQSATDTGIIFGIKEKEIDREDKQRQLIMDFLNAFTSEGGKRVLERISTLCNECSATYVDNNALGTAYKEGQRSVILHIRAMLAKNPSEERQEKAKS